MAAVQKKGIAEWSNSRRGRAAVFERQGRGSRKKDGKDVTRGAPGLDTVKFPGGCQQAASWLPMKAPSCLSFSASGSGVVLG